MNTHARPSWAHPDDPRRVPRPADVPASVASFVCGVLMLAGTFAAAVRFAGSAPYGRAAGAFLTLVLGITAFGAAFGRGWALGVAFLVALCWIVSVCALGVQGRLGIAQWLLWLAWSFGVIGTSLAARRSVTQ